LFVVPLRYASRADAAVKIPENIRIGLYFKANSMSTAVSSFSISAEKGMQIGFLDGGKFVEVYEESSSNSITVRKDTYYIKSGSAFKEANASSATSADGEKLGPYHIRIGKEYKDLESTYEKIAAYKKNGVDAYPVYTGKWQIWSGFFADADSAEKRMDKIERALKDEKISLIEPAGGRIAAFSAKDEPLFLLSSDSVIFQAVPAKKNDPRLIRLNGTLYRGAIEARRFASSDMTVINTLKMEEYLYGVVPCEMESSSHPEALKAQAVAARTYAVYNMGKYQGIGFDLCNTVYSQVYKGIVGGLFDDNCEILFFIILFLLLFFNGRCGFGSNNY
jgi:stage II sporulation protein D